MGLRGVSSITCQCKASQIWALTFAFLHQPIYHKSKCAMQSVKIVDFSQKRKVNMEDRWENGQKEGNSPQMNDYLLQNQVKTCFPNVFTQLIPVNLCTSIPSRVWHKQGYLALKYLAGCPIHCTCVDCGPELPKERQRLSEQFLGFTANVKFQPINPKDFFTIYPRTHYGQCSMILPRAIMAIHAGLSLNAL